MDAIELHEGRIVRGVAYGVFRVLGVTDLKGTLVVALKELRPKTWAVGPHPVLKMPVDGVVANTTMPETAPKIPGYNLYFQGEFRGSQVLDYRRDGDASTLLPRWVTVFPDGSWKARAQKSVDAPILAEGDDFTDIATAV